MAQICTAHCQVNNNETDSSWPKGSYLCLLSMTDDRKKYATIASSLFKNTFENTLPLKYLALRLYTLSEFTG